MTELTKNVPTGWESVPLTEVATLIRGVTYKKEDALAMNCDGYVPLLRATNITGTALTFDALVYVPQSCVSDDQLLREGDVVIASSSGSKEIVGKAGQFFGGSFRGAFGAFCTGIRPHVNLYARYLGFYCQSPDYREVISAISAGSNINNIKSSELAAHLIPLPPRPEQSRIVLKLEELLSDLDAGVAELTAAQKKLEQYRQSLLKAAVEGTLTADWRQRQSGASVESGAELLERILRERRARWEARQLAKFKEQGMTPPKYWQAKYPQPVTPDVTDLPALPQGWVWTSAGMVSESIVPNRDKPLTFTGEIPWITTPDFEQEGLYLQHSKSGLGLTLEECSEYRARVVPTNSVIMTCVGRLGLSAVLKADAVINQQLHAFLPGDGIAPEFLAYVIEAQSAWLHANATATTIAYLNKGKCEALPTPLPPADEMLEIVAIVNGGMQAVIQQMRSIDYSLRQSAAQRKNILQAAFSGQLVPQDPADEPASVLLARIRTERLVRAAEPTPRRRGARKNQ